MRGVRRDMNCLTRPHQVLCAAKGSLEFALKDRKGFLEVMTVRGRAAARRNVHVDQTELARRIFAGEKDGVRVPDYSYMGKLAIRLCDN